MYRPPEVKRRRNPREKAGLLSIATFSFALDIFKRSARHDLQDEDIYRIPKGTSAGTLGDTFEQRWLEEKSKPHPSLTKLLFRVFGFEYMVFGFAYFAVKMFTMFVQPVAVGRLVGYFETESTMSTQTGCLYGLAVVAIEVFTGSFAQYYYYSLEHLGLKVKVSLMSLMYRKSLKLSQDSLKEITNGRVVTMTSKDLNVFETVLPYGHDMWIGIGLLLAMVYTIYTQVDWTAALGIGFLVAIIPFQFWLGVLIKRLRILAAARTDGRIRRIQEVLTSIKLIKYYNWEEHFRKVTNYLRGKEMNTITRIFNLRTLVFGLSGTFFRLAFFFCIMSYSSAHHLTAEKAFVVFSSFGVIDQVYYWLGPLGLLQLAEAKSSIKRIKRFLLTGEVSTDHSGLSKLSAHNASIGGVLKGVNFEAAPPSLLGLTGTMASGKTTFLQGLLGEVQVTGLVASGSFSYASQEPWLFPGTLRQNILFGQPYDPKRYQRVLSACALLKDLDIFPEHDSTVISDKGLNLSRGQQCRVNLARAVYKEADVYLLDDVFSALDARVRTEIFEECIKTFLKDKLRLLVCHNTLLLQQTDSLLIFERGTVRHAQHADKIDLNLGQFASIDASITTNSEVVEDVSAEDAQLLPKEATAIYGEVRKEGSVSMAVYKQYLTYAGGWSVVAVVIFLAAMNEYIAITFDYHMGTWVEVEEHVAVAKTALSEDPNNATLIATHDKVIEERRYALAVYLGLMVLSLWSMLYEFVVYRTMIRASRRMHKAVVDKVMSASMLFFDKQLSGNILNRFSKDFSIVDDVLPISYTNAINWTIIFGFTLILIVQTWYLFLVPILLLFVTVYHVSKVYLKASRCLRRLEAASRAPIVGHLISSLEGLATIRAASNQDVLKEQFDEHVDYNASTMLMYITVKRAFGFWINIVVNLFSTGIIYAFIFFQDVISAYAGNIGVVISKSFTLSSLRRSLEYWTDLENSMVSAERVLEYAESEQEDQSGTTPNCWPKSGGLEFKGVTLQYPLSKTRQLVDASFSVRPKEKIGIIGRTGSGKSSLISVLFRLYDVEGTVLVDGHDICGVPVHKLRKEISLIPQTSVIFEGTLRSNLDPYAEYSDADLWRVLGEVGLKATVEKVGLDRSTAECTLSAGQVQLLCLARSLLKRNSVLILDEATANVDLETEKVILATVERLFRDCTVLTIAHKLANVMDADRIMIVDGGRIVEMDAPGELLRKGTGVFYNLAKLSGLVP